MTLLSAFDVRNIIEALPPWVMYELRDSELHFQYGSGMEWRLAGIVNSVLDTQTVFARWTEFKLGALKGD